jgi:nitrogenase molybdenum-iron protein alpha/beta subunit
MKQVAGLISTYSSDEFGICSALYELGGMVVMHDASGCNSTYTTHDEPRWYDMDSMIYISAISEMEAIMGDDDKFIADLVETANELQPKFIAVVGAPIPYMIGTDLHAIAALTSQQTGIPAFGLDANGMHNYVRGVSMALETIVKQFCKRDVQKTGELSLNLLGVTPLDFSMNGSVDSIKKWLSEENMNLNCCMAMGSSLEEIVLAGQAHVNLVLSYGGLAAAKACKALFGTPYVVGVPFGCNFARKVARQIRAAAQTGVDCIAYQTDEISRMRPKKKIGIIGESVFSASLAEAIMAEYKDLEVQVFCPLDTEATFLRQGDRQTVEEDELIEAVTGVDAVIADPLYRAICPENVSFYALPHVAFSGRMYEREIPDCMNRKLQLE